MSSILLFAVLSASVVSTNEVCHICNGEGRIIIPCADCKGRGFTTKVRRGGGYGGAWYNVPCSRCAKGLVGPRQMGTGKVDVKCPLCNGAKIIRKKVSKTPLRSK